MNLSLFVLIFRSRGGLHLKNCFKQELTAVALFGLSLSSIKLIFNKCWFLCRVMAGLKLSFLCRYSYVWLSVLGDEPVSRSTSAPGPRDVLLSFEISFWGKVE